MNFLFVDRILQLNPGHETVGLKHVTVQDAFLNKRSDDRTILLSSIMGEALGQLCSWNVLKTTDFKFRPVGGVIQEIQMFEDAFVYDTILLESTIEALDVENPFVSFSGRASVDGKTLLTVNNSLAPLLPLEEFNDIAKVRMDFERLCHANENDVMNSAIRPTYYRFNYEKLNQNEKELVTKKIISPSAFYLADHFPRKPVFPLSLLIQYNLHLALTELYPTEKKKRVCSVRKVKIGNFVLPGDEIITKISVKEQSQDRVIIRFHNEVNTKKVCIAEAELSLR